MNNGFCTNPFKLSRGVTQGCPLSPYLFILSVEILACKIRQNREIQGTQIFKKGFKISQFAGDTSLLCSSCESVKNAIQVLNNFGVVSGLRLNPSKTKALWVPGGTRLMSLFNSTGQRSQLERWEYLYLTIKNKTN